MTENATGGLRPQYQTYTRQKCFIAYSEQAHWAVDLLSACEEVLSQPEYNLEADYARKHFAADVPLRQKALELIANARYGIYDLSFWRQDERSPWQMPRNVMIELGIAIALNRPILLLRHASNRDLPLPKGLQGMSDQILEFSGPTTLKKVLAEHLPKWINTPPETAWWNRHCNFGGKVCEYREAHPKAKQLDKKELDCTIADGEDPCRPDFRAVVEDVLERFGDVTYTYLDALSLQEGYSSLLCSHCQITRSSPFAIYRITTQTPVEAFISIGMSLALETQFEYRILKILMTENSQDVPSLLSGYEVVVACSDAQRRKILKEHMPKVLDRIRETSWSSKPLPFQMLQPLLDEVVEMEGVTATEPGLDLVDEARIKKGWDRTDPSWLMAAQTNKLVLDRFWERQPIPEEYFKAICQAVNIEDWENITRAFSGFSTLRTILTDANLLKATIRDLGFYVKTEADVRGYGGQRVRADVVAVLEGEYDVGWSRNADGSFDLIADLWGISKKYNQIELIHSINQKYAVNKALAEVKRVSAVNTTKCPICDSSRVTKYGSIQGRQQYRCQNCRWLF